MYPHNPTLRRRPASARTGAAAPRSFAAVKLCVRLGLLLCLWTSPGWGLTIESGLKSAARTTIGHMVASDYDAAFRLSDSLIAADTAEPLGYILRLLTFGMRMLDYDEFLDSALFLNTYAKTDRVITAYEGQRGRSSYSLTMGGFAKAVHAAFYLQQKKYFAALGTGMDALKLLNGAKSLDRCNVDVDIFLGMYDYAKAELRRKLWMVLFWYAGDKQQGKRRLEECCRKAEIAPDAARLALMDVYVQEKQFRQAQQLLQELDQRFPSSRFLLWGKARCCLAQKDYAAAAVLFNELALSYETDALGGYNGLNTRLQQIDCLMKAGKRYDAVAVGATALNRSIAVQQRRLCAVRDKIAELIKKG